MLVFARKSRFNTILSVQSASVCRGGGCMSGEGYEGYGRKPRDQLYLFCRHCCAACCGGIFLITCNTLNPQLQGFKGLQPQALSRNPGRVRSKALLADVRGDDGSWGEAPSPALARDALSMQSGFQVGVGWVLHQLLFRFGFRLRDQCGVV